MTHKELDNVLPDTKNIHAIVGFRFSEDTPFTCVATFLSLSDAKIFVDSIRPAVGVGQYQLIAVSDQDSDERQPEQLSRPS